MRTDYELLERISEALLEVPWFQPFLGSIHLAVNQGEVDVDGQVPADSLRLFVLRLVGSIPGVRNVIDHLRVAENSSRVGVQFDWGHGKMSLT